MTTLSVEPFDATVPTAVVHTSSTAGAGAIRFDANTFLLQQGHSQEMIQEAREEHAERQQSVCISGESLRKDFGAAMVVFFQWQKCASGVCAILLILSIINYAMFASKESVDFSLRVSGSNITMQIASWYSHFFISQYTKRQRAAWLSTCIVALVVVFLACPVFAWAVRRINGRIDDPGTEAKIVRFADNGTIDVSSAYASTSTLALRRLLSVTIFGIFIGVQVIVSYFLTKADSGSLGISFAISFLAAVLNIAYGLFARYLTEVEKHGHISTYNTSVAIKLILFKLANVMSVYGAKTYSATAGTCVYDIIGEQFMTLILVDIVFTTPITVILAYVQSHFHQQIATILGSINGDNANKAQFDLSAEYLNNLYRFYITVMALVVFPLSTVMSLVSFFFAFWAAKFRLVKICGDPGRSQNSQRWVVAGFMALMCVAALLTPYAGAAFILSGWTAEHTTSMECPFPN